MQTKTKTKTLATRSLSLNDAELDTSTSEFWNMTLDDFDDDDSDDDEGSCSIIATECDSCSRKNHIHCSNQVPGVRQARRMSDGCMIVAPSAAVKKRCRQCRSVTFGNVKVRTCELVLGDNPSFSGNGPSLSLGWKYNKKEKVVALDTFEKKRIKERKSMDKLQLSPEKREKIAKRNGFSRHDIEENAKQMAQIHRRRERTLKEVEREELLKHLTKSSASHQTTTLAQFLQSQTAGRYGSYAQRAIRNI